jgi:hypothetical protein
MDLFAEKRYGMKFDWVTLLEPDLIAYSMRESDLIYGFWFFEAYYRSFGKQLSIISRKFMPETEAAVEELLSFTADM